MSVAIEKHISVPAAAESLKVAEEKVRAWIESGELLAINVATSASGRPRWRIPQSSFDAFLARRSSEALVA